MFKNLKKAISDRNALAETESNHLRNVINGTVYTSQSPAHLVYILKEPDEIHTLGVLTTLAEEVLKKKDQSHISFSTATPNDIITAMCKKVQNCEYEEKGRHIYNNYCTILLDHIFESGMKNSERINLFRKTMDFETEHIDQTTYRETYKNIFYHCIRGCSDKETLFPILDFINKKAGRIFETSAHPIAIANNTAAFEWILECDDTEHIKKEVLDLKINGVWHTKEIDTANIEAIKNGKAPRSNSLDGAYNLFEFMNVCEVYVYGKELADILKNRYDANYRILYLQKLHTDLHSIDPKRLTYKPQLYGTRLEP